MVAKPSWSAGSCNASVPAGGLQELSHITNGDDVERIGRFIQQEIRWTVNKYPSKGYFHAFSLREARGGCVGKMHEAEEFERIVHSSLDNDRRNLPKPGEVHQVLAGCKARVNSCVIKQGAQVDLRGERIRSHRPFHLFVHRRRMAGGTPATIRKTVVFPAPFAPRMPVISPSRAMKETPLTAACEPKCFCKSRISIIQ
jgi:hypothetical protein